MNSRRPVNSDVMSLFMRFIRYSLCAGVLLGVASGSCVAKSWRGLVPLLTTRAQVLEMLGSPKLNASDQTESFDLPNEVVVIRWIRPTCGTQTPIPKGESFRPSDVVLQITVNPKVPLEMNTLDDNPKPKTYRDWLAEDINCVGDSEGHWSSCSIINRHDGFGYSTGNAHITALYYFASDSEADDWNATHKSCSPSGAT
jgi:hypothetical protein